MAVLTIDELFRRLQEWGTGDYGLSDVTQLEHALQSAALAKEQGLGDAQVIAALFHDIGHLTTKNDVALADHGIDDRHEDTGGAMLRRCFGEAVAEPVRLHVAAKRYLCTVEPDYFSTLSEDSVRSLELQGGLLNDTERAAFEAEPWFREGVALRRIDDLAKEPGKAVPELTEYRAMADALAAGGH